MYKRQPDRFHIVDGHCIFKFVLDDAGFLSLAQTVSLELPVVDPDDASFEWSLDGSRLFCMRGCIGQTARLDVFDTKTGSLLWRTSAGMSMGISDAPQLSISSDGCCLAITKQKDYGVPQGDREKDYGIRLFIPAVICFSQSC